MSNKMLSNLSGSANWGEEEVYVKPPVVEKVVEEYTGPEFGLGNLVTSIKHPDWGNGVIFKKLSNFNFWVAWYTKADEHLTSMPCYFGTHNRRDLKLIEFEKN